MARARGDDKLVCSHSGGWQWVDFELMRTSRGYAIIAPCSLGDHWLQQDLSIALEEHFWPSASAAIAARGEWRARQGR